MKLRAVMTDGSVNEAETKLYMCFADRIAFERRFGTNGDVISEYLDLLDPETGEKVDGADMSGFRDEWTAFFVWRCLKRALPDLPDFEIFVEQIARIEFNAEAAEHMEDDEEETFANPIALAAQ